MKEGDWLLCKNDYYEGDHIDYNGNITGRSKISKVFRKPIFKKGVKYELAHIETIKIPAGGTGGYVTANNITYFTCHTYYIYTNKDYNISGSSLLRAKPSQRLGLTELESLFYTHKEERALKLKKLNLI